MVPRLRRFQSSWLDSQCAISNWKALLRRVLKGFSARYYCIAPRLWQPDFGWDHAGVPLAFSMALTTYSGLFDGIKR